MSEPIEIRTSRPQHLGSDATNAHPTLGDATVTHIQVSGMTCGHCSAAVSGELSALPGVTAVSVDLRPGEDSPVTITSEAPLDPEAIGSAVAEAGYTVR